MKPTIEPLHPAQVQAFEKLKGLRVGALYIERQEGKLTTVVELARYRLSKGRVDGVLWLCTRRRVERLSEGILRHGRDIRDRTELVLRLMEQARQTRLMLIIDNGLLIKNGAALRTQRVIELSRRCPYRLLISDVPFTRHVEDMFTQWLALDWRILGYRSDWAFRLNHLDAWNRGVNTDYLVRAIEPYCAQIRREDVQPAAKRREYVWKFSLPAEAMAEYRRVTDRFLAMAPYSSSGVYRMLQACQHVACGRRVLQDYPLETAPLYASDDENPRLTALLDVLERIPGRRTLILYRYHHEGETLLAALRRVYGEDSAGRYSERETRRFTVMNIFTDEREH
ncbi:MAG: hypothetical protein Q4P84_08810, partial [Elusimicrobiales bacterium]|nr:hypothetical protein [Elusimicrobiales bacterium]